MFMLLCLIANSKQSCWTQWEHICKLQFVLQMGFFSIVGIPLFKAMAEIFEDAQPMLDGVLANYHHWEAATPDAELPAVK